MFDVVEEELIGWDDLDDWLEGSSDGVIGLLDETEAPTDDVIGLLDATEPGVLLGIMLSSIDVAELDGDERVSVMAAHQRMASHHQAQVYRAMASVADAVEDVLAEAGETDPEVVEDAAASEIRAALRLTRRAAQNELAVARDYQDRLPEVWEAFERGRLDRRRANLILYKTDHLPEQLARQVASEALERAPDLTTGQLGALLRRLAVEADPEEATKRYEAALDGRRVVLEPSTDGTAHLHLLDLPPDRAARIRGRLDALARSLRGRGETRTMDQLRADVVLDLLDPEHGVAEGGRGTVVLTVDIATLAGLTEHSGDLGGYGPVVADIARQIADDSLTAEWRFVVTDENGQPRQAGLTRRRPTEPERRLVETVFPRCVGPGCRLPATQCDLDHITPWESDGPTEPGNLAPLCRFDHRVRHQAGWTYERTEDGTHLWTSTLGRRYETEPRGP